MKAKPAKPVKVKEPIVQNPLPEEPRNPPPPSETALAESKPDNSHILLRIIRMLLGIQGQPGHTLGTFGAIFIVLVWTFATFAVPAILAIAAVMPRHESAPAPVPCIEVATPNPPNPPSE